MTRSISRRMPVALAMLLLLWGAALPRPAAALDIQRVRSPGGIEAWLVRDTSVPVVSFNFAFRAGAAVDPPGKSGRADMVSSLLDEGAGELSSQEFQGQLEDIAASLRFTSSMDRFRGSLRTLSANRDEAFRLLALALTRPRFDENPVERIRAQMIAGLRHSLQDPDTIASRTWFRTAFPEHPYGQSSDGTIESVNAITVADLRDFTRRYLVRSSLVVGVAGDISSDELARRLDEVFGGLPAAGRGDTIPHVKPAAAGRLVVIPRNVPQSVVMFGHEGIARKDPDWYAAYVMMRVLGGGGLVSRLHEEVREKRGLAYSVYAYLNPYDHAALIMGGVATANQRVAESLRIIRSEWRRMAEQGVGEEELAAVKTYINGSFPLRLDSTRRIAGMLVSVQLHELGIDYLSRRSALISGVTVEDVRRVARRLLKPDALTVVVVGQPEGINPAN